MKQKYFVTLLLINLLQAFLFVYKLNFRIFTSSLMYLFILRQGKS